MSFSIDRLRVEEFDAIQIQIGIIALAIIPELGGKVSSLCDSPSNREWLWRHPRYPYKHVPHGSSYVAEADTRGWDECFPSVSACEYSSEPWQGVAIQDHSELWSQAPDFEIKEHGEKLSLQTRWQGVALPYIFTRTITLTANSSVIRSNYEVTNNVDQTINFVWCIHPLLVIEPAMELQLPHAARFHADRYQLFAAFPPHDSKNWWLEIEFPS